MDPTVQVAVVSVIATCITTLGVVATAIINNKKERQGAANAAVAATSALDEKEILERMLTLIADIEKKDEVILDLQHDLRKLKTEIRLLKQRLSEHGLDHQEGG